MYNMYTYTGINIHITVIKTNKPIHVQITIKKRN